LIIQPFSPIHRSGLAKLSKSNLSQSASDFVVKFSGIQPASIHSNDKRYTNRKVHGFLFAIHALLSHMTKCVAVLPPITHLIGACGPLLPEWIEKFGNNAFALINRAFRKNAKWVSAF
jgi:hypothetical protein